MPVEIYDLEEFMNIAKRAVECRVKKVRKRKKKEAEKTEKKEDIEIAYVKFKARTRRYLYTIKVDKDKADELVNKLPCSRIVIIDEKGNVSVIEKKK